MDATPNLDLPYIMGAQAQKHVTHNEAIRTLDALVQLGVIDRDLTAPPVTPANGERYIVASGATGDWSGHDLQIAAFQDGAWAFYVPANGWLAWVADESALLAWNGSAWAETDSGMSVNPAPLVGVNATADATNRLSVKSDAVLFSHDDVTPGTGDQRTILNKATTGNTASFLFQSNWSGRAEIGLTGSDDFAFKVSPDGSAWHDALTLKRDGSAVVAGLPVQHTLPPRLPVYTIGTRPSASTYATGSLIYVSDWPDGGIAMVSDGTEWRPMPRRAGRVSEILDGDEGVAFNFRMARALIVDVSGVLSASALADDAVTLTRASDATFIGSNGLLQSASSNVLRYTCHPLTREPHGLLLEGGATNECTRSVELDHANWSKTRASVTANAATAPDGATTADKLVEDNTASNTHFASRVCGGAQNVVNCGSIWVRAAERSKGRIALLGASGQCQYDFDLDTKSGTAINSGNATLTSGGVEEYAGGWFRVWVSGRLHASTPGSAYTVALYLADASGAISYTGDNSSGFYAWGAQAELGPRPTSYIPTTSAAATRAADSLAIGPSTFPVPPSGACTLYWRGRFRGLRYDGSGAQPLNANGGSSDESIRLRESTALAGVDVNVSDGGSTVADTSSAAIAFGATCALAVSVRSNDLRFYANGAVVDTDSSLTLPTIDRLAITPGPGSIYEIDHLAYIARARSPSELAILTA